MKDDPRAAGDSSPITHHRHRRWHWAGFGAILSSVLSGLSPRVSRVFSARQDGAQAEGEAV